jgi:hypothetical protein
MTKLLVQTVVWGSIVEALKAIGQTIIVWGG